MAASGMSHLKFQWSLHLLKVITDAVTVFNDDFSYRFQISFLILSEFKRTN